MLKFENGKFRTVHPPPVQPRQPVQSPVQSVSVQPPVAVTAVQFLEIPVHSVEAVKELVQPVQLVQVQPVQLVQPVVEPVQPVVEPVQPVVVEEPAQSYVVLYNQMGGMSVIRV